MNTEPQVQQYLDYRKFLEDWVSYKKTTQTSFSNALFAKKAKLSSPTLLGMVIRGKRNLSYRTIQAFIDALGLKKDQAKYFENLVLLNQAQTPDEKMKYLAQFKDAQLKSNPKIKDIRDTALYFSQFHVIAVRELTRLSDFKLDVDWIYAKLKKKYTKSQIESAIDVLKRLELIQIKEGKVVAAEGKIQLLPNEPNPALRAYYRSYFERMISALDQEPMEERELGFITLAVSPEDFKEIKKRMNETLTSLVQEYGKNSKENKHVITVQMQALQLTNQTQ